MNLKSQLLPADYLKKNLTVLMFDLILRCIFFDIYICWSFGVTLSAPMVYDEIGDVCMCVYDDVGVIINFLMSCSIHTVACTTEPIDSTRSVSILICCSTGIQTARPRPFRSIGRARVQNALCFLAR